MGKARGQGTVIKGGVPFASTVKGLVIIYCNYMWLIIPTCLCTGIHENVMQSNLVNNGYYANHINKLSVLSSLNLEKD